jgi:hypothetical protein
MDQVRAIIPVINQGHAESGEGILDGVVYNIRDCKTPFYILTATFVTHYGSVHSNMRLSNDIRDFSGDANHRGMLTTFIERCMELGFDVPFYMADSAFRYLENVQHPPPVNFTLSIWHGLSINLRNSSPTRTLYYHMLLEHVNGINVTEINSREILQVARREVINPVNNNAQQSTPKQYDRAKYGMLQ